MHQHDKFKKCMACYWDGMKDDALAIINDLLLHEPHDLQYCLAQYAILKQRLEYYQRFAMLLEFHETCKARLEIHYKFVETLLFDVLILREISRQMDEYPSWRERLEENLRRSIIDIDVKTQLVLQSKRLGEACHVEELGGNVNIMVIRGKIESGLIQEGPDVESWIERWIEVEHDNPDAHLARSRFLLNHQRFHEAISAAKSAVAISKRYYEAWFQLFLIYRMQGNDYEAIRSFYTSMTFHEGFHRFFNQNSIEPSDPAFIRKFMEELKTSTSQGRARERSSLVTGSQVFIQCILSIQAGDYEAARFFIKAMQVRDEKDAIPSIRLVEILIRLGHQEGHDMLRELERNKSMPFLLKVVKDR
ncbi:MAG: hypothetical protein ACTSU9_04285, partial [Promethearchaeota archaeon]